MENRHGSPLVGPSSIEQGYVTLKFSDFAFGGSANPIPPHSTRTLVTIDYCAQCAVQNTRDDPIIGAMKINESTVTATVWIEGHEFSDEKTVKQLVSAHNGT
jgi:hypothetical protein